MTNVNPPTATQRPLTRQLHLHQVHNHPGKKAHNQPRKRVFYRILGFLSIIGHSTDNHLESCVEQEYDGNRSR